MAKITQYTQENTPQAVNQGRAAQAADFGGNQTGLQAQASALRESAQELADTGTSIEQIETKRNNRIETINRVRELDQFYNETFEEFNRTQSEEDLVNPAVAESFQQKLREKASKYIQNHTGTEESRANLEAKILAIQGDFSRQITQNSIVAQRKFIMDKAGGSINQIVNEVRQNPSTLGDGLKQADVLIGDLSSALYPEDEMALIEAAQEQIAVGAIQSFTDSGQYEEARDLINENPFFVKSLRPEQMRQLVTEIDRGIREQTKQTREIQNKTAAIKAAADELGLTISGPQVFSAVTGITNAQTPQAKIDEFAKVSGMSVDKLTPSVIAKIGFGVDLPAASEIDYNKEFTPTGDLTPKGIGGKVKEPFDRAAAVKTYKDKIDGAIGLFNQGGNSQALLSAMITFQKALDEGAVVREGDIALQRSADSLAEKIKLIATNAKTGQPVSESLVVDMQATMNDFASSALKNEKTLIDPLLEEADRLGYKRISIIPEEAYNNVFGGVNADPKKPAKTGATTMTADEFLSQ